MSLANRALWTIDRNLTGELTLARIAENCGVSRYHLAHAFGETTGMSVMEYVRSRRLSEAAINLAKGASNILDLALDYGYASHEAFSRAFRTQFGMTPEDVRKKATTEGLAVLTPVKAQEGTRPAIAPIRSERLGELKFVGLCEHVPFSRLQNIAAQWQRFMPRYGEIEDKAHPIPAGVSTNLDEEGNFDYICAVEVKRFGALPKGLMRIILPPQTYTVFRHDSHVSEIGQTYRAIWDDWVPDKGRTIPDAASIERHMETFDTR
ncbi:MAG TPA: AraC family transcriptional regulator, partial [Rhizomicrobium sp.]|nr:AraC family transcriptional regulator [Rhizomicrobium sp.]